MDTEMTLTQALYAVNNAIDVIHEYSPEGPKSVAAARLTEAYKAIESAQAELTELRAIVARLREPVSDDAIKSAAIAFDKSPIRNNGPMRAALTAHNKRILGETE